MKKTISILAAAALAVLAPSSCDKNELSVPEVQKQYIFDPAGGTVFASISASGEFTAVSDQSWCYVEAYDHKYDNLRISVSENTLASDREAVISLGMKGAEKGSITVRQFASEPFITAVTKAVVLDASATDFEVTVSANTLYAYTLPSWISDAAENEVSTGQRTFYFRAQPISANEERSGEITFRSADNPLVSAAVSVRQTNEVLPLLDDSFDWCTGTATAFGSTSGEVRIDNLPNTNGWTSETVNGNYNCWARSGHLRFSRTGYGGILVSPALGAINGTADVKVTFQAARWCNTSGVHDDNFTFSIVVRGGGTPSVSSVEVTCDYDTDNWQSKDGSTYSFTITGATPSTQIVWISSANPNGTIPSTDGNGDGTSQNVGRLVLDNVKVEYL